MARATVYYYWRFFGWDQRLVGGRQFGCRLQVTVVPEVLRMRPVDGARHVPGAGLV
jgi:hypothetical protein